jgi:predicted transcriptional regulator
MDKKQREALVIALSEKGKTYREIAKEAGVSPNTIKAVLNKAGLDQSTSISSRAFELYVKQKTPVEVAIALNLEAEKAINYYHEYLMLLGITEFTKIYLQIKDNPWPFVNLAKLIQNARIGEGEVVELLRIANGYLPRVRLEYDRVKEEINSSKAELNSWKAANSNEVRVYQQFVDRNIKLNRREDELQLSINGLEVKEDELQKTISELKQQLSELRESTVDNNNLDLEIKQEEVIFTNDVFIPPTNMAVGYHQDENETPHYCPKAEPLSRTLIFDTKDLF